MKLVLVRHGETNENANGIIQGHRFGTLSQKGKNQVSEVAKKLSKEKFDIIYSSDLERCVDTAKAIHKFHKNTELILRTELREFGFGRLEGLRAPRSNRFAKFGIKIPRRFFGAESLKNVRERLIPFINHIMVKHNSDTVLVVTHGGPIRILKSAIENQSLEFGIDVPNCSVWRFEINEQLPLK